MFAEVVISFKMLRRTSLGLCEDCSMHADKPSSFDWLWLAFCPGDAITFIAVDIAELKQAGKNPRLPFTVSGIKLNSIKVLDQVLL